MPKPMTAGRLQYRVRLRLPTLGTKDAYGQPAIVPADYGPFWACVEWTAGAEPVVAGGVQPQTTYMVTIRAVDGSISLGGKRVTSSWQVLWTVRGVVRVLDVVSVMLDPTGTIWQTLVCRERVGNVVE